MQTYFITGAQGCIGSWIVKALVERGDVVVVFDRSDDPRRLKAIMSAADLARVQFVCGDITDVAAVGAAVAGSGARRIIHLAGLQVPTCKADPVAGAFVNVIGTLNVFECAKAAGVERIVYASSAAVYGDADVSLTEADATEPLTHYGVFKRANEGNARIYFLDHGISSVGLRPLTVYGVNRDTGLTSDPTKAMKAAVLGIPFHIRFGGATDFQYVEDTAAAFIACADRAPAGAHVFNLHGETVETERIASVINQTAGHDLVTFGGPSIPIAAAIDDAKIKQAIPGLPSTPLTDGINKTMRQFRQLQESGRLDSSDIEAEIAAARGKTV
jgi:nucleoside-diphosphate-sugar epimerase